MQIRLKERKGGRKGQKEEERTEFPVCVKGRSDKKAALVDSCHAWCHCTGLPARGPHKCPRSKS